MTDPAALRELWRRIPVDDVGYFTAEELLAKDDGELRALVNRMAEARYRGWRNHKGRYREVLGLDSTRAKTVLDYGCGIGLDALQYAKVGNRIWLADLHQASVALAARVLDLHGYPAAGTTPILSNPPPVLHARLPGIPPATRFDVIHCAGVLHHIPFPQPVLEGFRWILAPGGELRLLLYSDRAWRQVIGTDPPDQVAGHPAADRYASHMDMAGSYADWYDPARLARRTEDLFRITRCEYVGKDGTLLAAVLTLKENRA